jgi:hypothetical protein
MLTETLNISTYERIIASDLCKAKGEQLLISLLMLDVVCVG